MADWGREEDRATWFDLGQAIRHRHETWLGAKPMLVSDRDGYVLPQVFFFQTVSDVYSLPYPIDGRAAILELLVRWARERGALAIGTVFQGVSPEEEAGKIDLRPTILSSLLGLGRFDGWLLEVNQRIDREGSALIMQTPLVHIPRSICSIPPAPAIFDQRMVDVRSIRQGISFGVDLLCSEAETRQTTVF